MHRVIGLYRTPWFPFFRSKLARIEEMLSYQGKVYSVESDRLDAAELADSDGMDHDEDLFDEAASEFEEFDTADAGTR